MLNYTIKLIACYTFQKYVHDLTVKWTRKIAVSLARSFIFYFLTDVNVQFGLQPMKTTRDPFQFEVEKSNLGAAQYSGTSKQQTSI